MELVSHSSLPATLLSWSRTGTPSSTLVCKITLELGQGTAKVASTQLSLLEEDQFVDDDANRSIVAAHDLAPFKPRADVILVGHAYAPQGEPVRSLVARLSVAGIDKAIEVHCDRVLTPNGKILDGPWFSDMPLVYERSAGGPTTDNPVGVPPDATADDHFGTQLPNLEALQNETAPLPVDAPGLRRTLVGFGPLAPTWPERMAKAGRHLTSFLDGSWTSRALPKDFDPSFFNVAPIDQRVDRLAEGLRLTLENLHPQHPRLVCTLPRVRPRVFTEVGGALDEFAVAADTLWIDTTRAIATLTFRGQLAPRPGAHRVHVLLEEAVRPYAQADIRRICDVAPAPARASTPPAAPSSRKHTTVRIDDRAAAAAPAGARISERARPRLEEVTCADDTNSGDASPDWLRKAALGAPATPPSEPPPSERTQSIVMNATAVPTALASPPVSAPPAVPVPSPSSAPAAPSRPATVWATPAHVQAEGYAAEGRKSRPQFADDTPFARATFSSSPALEGPLAIPVGAPSIDPAQGAGLLALSNAAAARVPEPMRVDEPEDLRIEPAPASDERATPAPILDLLWFDPESLDRIRSTTRWVERIAASRPPVYDPDEAGGPPIEEPPDVIARCEVIGVLSGSAPTPISGLAGALSAAARARRGFEPPLVVSVGELRPSFDELDTLKATLSATSPFVGGDKKLKEVTDLCTELLATPWLDGATEVIEGLISRVRDAFHASSRGLPPSFLDTRVERTLLKQRKYSKATVFGKTWIRAQLAEQSSATPVPVYLSDVLAERLPMFRRFAVRLIAEVHLAQDQFEAHPHALRAVALAREAPAQPSPG